MNNGIWKEILGFYDFIIWIKRNTKRRESNIYFAFTNKEKENLKLNNTTSRENQEYRKRSDCQSLNFIL